MAAESESNANNRIESKVWKRSARIHVKTIPNLCKHSMVFYVLFNVQVMPTLYASETERQKQQLRGYKYININNE